MRAANILAGLVRAVWAALLRIGIGLIEGVTAQHVPGAPYLGQIFYYVGVPAALVAMLLVSAIVLTSLYDRRWSWQSYPVPLYY